MAAQTPYPPDGHGSPPLAVLPATGEALRRGLWLLCKDLPSEDRDDHLQRLLTHLRRSLPGTAGILQAQRGEKIVGALLWTVYPGRVAVISAPGLADGESLDTARELFAAVTTNLKHTQTRLIFANLSAEQDRFSHPLERAGFSHLARLLYLFSPAKDFPEQFSLPHLDFIAWPNVDPAEFTRTLEMTYIDTLDCPRLNGLRETEDVLAGYRAAGTYSPDLWFHVTHEGNPVGCLILTEHLDFDQLELVYMGLVPECRGRGWGRDLVRYAQWIGHQRKRNGLILAVDLDNFPARRVYESLNMQPLEERHIFLYDLATTRGGNESRDEVFR